MTSSPKETASGARFFRDAVRFAVASIRAHRTRSLLTALSMVVANASVILAVSTALTGRDFVVKQIQGVGSNLVYAYYEAGGNVSESEADYITRADVEAVRRQLGPRAQAVAGVMGSWDRLFIDGRERQIRVLGSSAEYEAVRNLKIPAGRFFDADDVARRAKVCLLTEPLAEKLFDSSRAAVGQSIPIHALRFTVIGVFREGVETLGQTEVAADSVLMPISVIEYFQSVERIDPLYVSVRSAGEVEEVTALVKSVLVSRHRPGSSYRVENLTAILTAAQEISRALTAVLVLVAALTLIISGIFIMNIMLISVAERTKEIGIRLSVGAERRQVKAQFLMEAVCLSMMGGLVGVAAGVAVPLVARVLLPELTIRIAPLSVAAALAVSCAVGVVFGLLPASRAAKLDPVEALRYE